MDVLLQEDQHARLLWQLIRDQAEGGQGGYLYICGQAACAQSIIAALISAVARFSSGSREEGQ
jgi:hypothetical protein